MQQKTRKLWGTVAIIALLIVYPLAVMQVYVTTMMGLPWWGAIVVLCIAGLLWFYPASWVVRWMTSRPLARRQRPKCGRQCWTRVWRLCVGCGRVNG